MLIFPDTQIRLSTTKPVQTGFTLTAEGQALVADTTGGVFGVKPSTGNATDTHSFVGFSLAQQLTLLYLPSYESLVASAGLAVTVANTPVGGTIRVYNVTKAVVVAAGAGAGQYGLVGSTFTVVAGGATAAGDTLLISYRYSPTTLQAQSIQGSIPAGGAAALTIGATGVITSGNIVTTEFDTSVDWSAANIAIATGANGVLTIGGNGATISGYVSAVPSTSSPYLGIDFTA